MRWRSSVDLCERWVQTEECFAYGWSTDEDSNAFKIGVGVAGQVRYLVLIVVEDNIVLCCVLARNLMDIRALACRKFAEILQYTRDVNRMVAQLRIDG